MFHGDAISVRVGVDRGSQFEGVDGKAGIITA